MNTLIYLIRDQLMNAVKKSLYCATKRKKHAIKASSKNSRTVELKSEIKGITETAAKENAKTFVHGLNLACM